MAMRDARAGHVPPCMARRFPNESRLVLACLQPQPHLRPTAAQLLAMLDVIWPTTDPSSTAPGSSGGGAAGTGAARTGDVTYGSVRQGGQRHARGSSLGSLAFEGAGVANRAVGAKAGAGVEVLEERGGVATPRGRMQGGVVGGGRAGSLSAVAPPPALLLLPPVSEGSGPSEGSSASGGRAAVMAGAAGVAGAASAVPVRQAEYDTSSSADSLPAARNASAFCGAASAAAAVALGAPAAAPRVPLPPGWLGVTSANSNPLPLRQQQQRRVSPCTAVLLEDRAVQTDVTWLYGSAPRSVCSSSSSPQRGADGATEVVGGSGKDGAPGSQDASAQPGAQQEQQQQQQQAPQGAENHSSVLVGSGCVLHRGVGSGVAAGGVGSGANGPGGVVAEPGDNEAVLRLKDAEIARLRALLAQHGIVPDE